MLEWYQADIATLPAALVRPAIVGPWLSRLEAELPTIAEQGLLDRLQRLQRLAYHLQAVDLDQLIAEDRRLSDQLLTDLFACASWERNPALPITVLPPREAAPPATAQHGLLAASADDPIGATLLIVDDHTLALARDRQVDSGVQPRPAGDA